MRSSLDCIQRNRRLQALATQATQHNTNCVDRDYYSSKVLIVMSVTWLDDQRINVSHTNINNKTKYSFPHLHQDMGHDTLVWLLCVYCQRKCLLNHKHKTIESRWCRQSIRGRPIIVWPVAETYDYQWGVILKFFPTSWGVWTYVDWRVQFGIQLPCSCTHWAMRNLWLEPDIFQLVWAKFMTSPLK